MNQLGGVIALAVGFESNACRAAQAAQDTRAASADDVK